MAIELLVSTLALIQLGVGELAPVIVRIAMTLAIFYFIFKKKKWARILMAVLLFLGGIAAFLEFDRIIFTMGAIFIGLGLTLLMSKSIKAYMDKTDEPVITDK